MHPDPNEGPTYQRVRTQADLDMFQRDLYEGRVMHRASEVCSETPGRQYHDARPEAFRRMLAEGDLPPTTWKPMTQGEWDVAKAFGLDIKPYTRANPSG